jgi:hypothetical protein
MLKITIDDTEYSFKNTIDDINIKEYFAITKIMFEKIEKPIDSGKKYVDGTYDIEYYNLNDEPEDIKLNKRIKVLSILTNIDDQKFIEYPELLYELEDYLEPLKYDDDIWKVKSVTKGKLKTPTNYEWCYDDPEKWCFQQWVDSENASKQSLLNPFLIAIYKKEKGSKKKRKYDRSLPEFDEFESFWLNQPAKDNIAVIYHILDRMSVVRDMFFWIYKAESEYPDTKDNLATKAYNEFAGWNDVVVSLAEHNFFNSPTGTLNAVRNSNCIDVLELLNWRRGKSFAEYEDYKSAERRREISNKNKR